MLNGRFPNRHMLLRSVPPLQRDAVGVIAASAAVRAIARAAATTVVFALAGVAGLLATAPTATAVCGISWSLPWTPFMGGDDYRFQLAEVWGEVKISEKLTIPIHVTFSPVGDRVSPILGSGWQFALFDATCVKESDNAYLMRLPDGNAVRLNKTQDAAVWEGGDWTARVAGRTITAESSCGWTLTYHSGRLQRVKMSEGDDTLDFITDLGKGTTHTLKANGKPVLTLRSDFDKITTQKLWHLNFSDKHAILKMGKRPFLVKVRDHKTNKPIEQKTERDTLVSVKFDGEKSESKYTFGLEDLKIEGRHVRHVRHIKWMKESGVLSEDTGVKYSFPTIAGIKCIKREYPDGQVGVRGWGNERDIMQEKKDSPLLLTEYVDVEGIRGIRKISQLKNGQFEVIRQNWFDLSGNVVKTMVKKENGEFIYKRNGNRILAEKNGKHLWEKVFDAQGRLIEFSDTKRKMKFAYSERRTLQVSVKNTNDEDKVSTFLVKGDALDNFLARFSNTNF
ncbi:MAG: hypothetical protein LBS59_07690 [Puniceicoccales bacterium]|nr:hypothetical protein [Puniceicoccales bacterium]